MNGAPPELSVVLPAYEEAESLDQLLPVLKRVLEGLRVTHEIVVIDAQTPLDNTIAICSRHGARCCPRVGGKLYGHAIRTAQEVARGNYIILMDADGSHNPEFVAQLWEHRDDANLIIASRYVRGGQTENPAILIFLSLVVNVIFRTVLGLKCADVSNSFRLYRGDELRALKLKCDNFDVVEEILVKLAFSRSGYTVKEIASVFEMRKAGITKRRLLAFAFGYLSTLAKLYRLRRTLARSNVAGKDVAPEGA